MLDFRILNEILCIIKKIELVSVRDVMWWLKWREEKKRRNELNSFLIGFSVSLFQSLRDTLVFIDSKSKSLIWSGLKVWFEAFDLILEGIKISEICEFIFRFADRGMFVLEQHVCCLEFVLPLLDLWVRRGSFLLQITIPDIEAVDIKSLKIERNHPLETNY